MIGVVDQGDIGALVLLFCQLPSIPSTILFLWTYSDDGLEWTAVL